VLLQTVKPYSTTPFLRDHLSLSLSRDAPFYGPQSLIGKYPPTYRIILKETNPLHNPTAPPPKKNLNINFRIPIYPHVIRLKFLIAALSYGKWNKAGVVIFGNQTVCQASARTAEPNHLSAAPKSTKPPTAKSNAQPTHIINHITWLATLIPFMWTTFNPRKYYDYCINYLLQHSKTLHSANITFSFSARFSQ
jgi:hypothetical protein